jgi:Methyltransferase domain
MSKSIIINQEGIYRDHFLEHGDTPEGTYNQNDAIQNLRFSSLIKNIDFNSPETTIHDVGCGICDLYHYMKQHNIHVQYSGTDIIAEMKTLALKKYPGIQFQLRDFLDVDTKDKYDFLVLSGTFNLPGKTDKKEWRAFTRAMIRKMYSLANYGISFNFLTTHADFYHGEMFYESPEDILNFCISNLSRHVIIDHSYPIFEYTVTVYTPELLRKQHTDGRLQKYIK